MNLSSLKASWEYLLASPANEFAERFEQFTADLRSFHRESAIRAIAERVTI